jgi:hypothetical protein
MRFLWYAELPGRWLRQLFVDLAVVCWAVFWVWLAVHVHGQIVHAAGPGTGLISAGTGLRDTFQSAAHDAGGVPIIGHQLADSLGAGTRAGTTLVNAGNSEVQQVRQLAFWTAFALVAGPLALVLSVWLPLRVRYALQAGFVRSMVRSGHHADLLALRALTSLSPRRLLALGPGVAEGWRAGDADVTAALMSAECARLGLRVRT